MVSCLTGFPPASDRAYVHDCRIISPGLGLMLNRYPISSSVSCLFCPSVQSRVLGGVGGLVVGGECSYLNSANPAPSSHCGLCTLILCAGVSGQTYTLVNK